MRFEGKRKVRGDGETREEEEETRLGERGVSGSAAIFVSHIVRYGDDGGCVVPEVGLGKLHPVQPQWRCAKSLIVDAS